MVDFISSPSDTDLTRAAELRRVKALATAVLVASLATFIAARWLSPLHPVFGFIAAFAEAATIGGLADWYAVVALFKRPLGLPIPHTAIIPANQARIAEKLGQFIETHFLADEPIAQKLRQTDFASLIADWLGDRKRSADLARYILRLAPDALAAADASGLKQFAGRRLVAQAEAIDLAPLLAGTLRGFVSEGKHQSLLDDLMRILHEAMQKPETLETIRDKIRNELPTLLRLYRTDRFLLNKITASVTTFFDEVRTDPAHPFRDEFDRFALSLVDKIASDPTYAERIATLKASLLARPELATLGQTIWDNVRAYIETSAAAQDSTLHRHLTDLFVRAGQALATDPDMRAEVNGGLVAVARRFVAEQKGGVSIFIAEQVKGWDMRQLIGLIEINIGRDLQYIRFNGAVIGGLAGLALHTIEVLLRLN